MAWGDCVPALDSRSLACVSGSAAGTEVVHLPARGGSSDPSARMIEAAGFTAVTADNMTGSKPAENTVRYGDASQAGTAARR